MQEDIERRTIAVSINAAKLTGRTLAKALAAVVRGGLPQQAVLWFDRKGKIIKYATVATVALLAVLHFTF